jgi:nitrous oxidase accessory protein NosD
MRSASSVVAVVTTLVLAVGLSAGSAAAATRTVGPGDSIQAAIDAAQPGDTIVVRGVHHENLAITKDGITLRGVGAVLEPAATPLVNVCSDPSAPDEVNGICIVGDVDFDTGTVLREIQNVTVTGFTVSGFNEGITAFGAHNATFQGNVATDNEEYGITAFVSTGTRFLFNRTSGAEEAGIYIGDSPNATATVVGNESFDNLFGILVRNSEHGSMVGNYVHDNCVGVPFFADIPGPAGLFSLSLNAISHNTKACPASEDAPFPVSGVGVALLGTDGVSLSGNLITGNVPSGESAFSGGVVVTTGIGGTPPTGNQVHGNVILHNQPDLFWDGTGTGNDFKGNVCQTSTPPGLCH